MTDEQLKIINDSIANIKLFCKSQSWCNDCPIRDNCTSLPIRWELIKKDSDNNG